MAVIKAQLTKETDHLCFCVNSPTCNPAAADWAWSSKENRPSSITVLVRFNLDTALQYIISSTVSLPIRRITFTGLERVTVLIALTFTSDGESRFKRMLYVRLRPSLGWLPIQIRPRHSKHWCSWRSPVLSDPVTACSSLQVIVRVEVTVYEDDRICSCEIQAHSPCKEISSY